MSSESYGMSLAESACSSMERADAFDSLGDDSLGDPTATASVERLTPRELGQWGESIAAHELAVRGWTVHGRNWRCRSGELDLVCTDPQRHAVVAVEVKTRHAGSRVPAIEAISRDKLARLRRLLVQWIADQQIHAPHLAVDLVAITVHREGTWTLTHIEDIA
ncbi:MAG: YraN family protein [Actinomycetaceae bacterium]|nr:YraN family protein [Actinomycetaceae bacterium]